MKQKLLLLILLALSATFAIGKEKNTASPAIGIKMDGFFASQGQVYFNISIKNIGDETLTNIYVTEGVNTFGIFFEFDPIASLLPGEEVTNLFAYKTVFCFDQSQVIVHATTAANIEITDLSANPNDYDEYGLLGSYYNDIVTNSVYYTSVDAFQNGIYQDTNNNNIMDVGDAVVYTYSINLFGEFTNGTIYDDNAIIENPNFNGSMHETTGIHYLTSADITLGYVYNSSSVALPNTCVGGAQFQDSSYCPCPNPTGANIITPLTSLQPNQITGTVKFNANADACATGLNFPNRRVSTTDGTYEYASYTGNNGAYQILIPNAGNYTTSAMANLSPIFSSNPASVSVTSMGTAIDYNNTNFCISSANNFSDLSVMVFNVNQAIPGEVATYRIYYSNAGSTNLNGSLQLIFDNGKLTFQTAVPNQNSATANSLSWNYTNLLPFELRSIDLTFTVLTPPTVNAGDILNFTLTGNPIAGDANPTNNTFALHQTVFSSFDPNDKTVIEGAYINPSQVSDYLHYVTRFQNTGTANATTVVIKETLDAKLDWTTFEPIASSHPSSIQIINGNGLTYTFSNIDLPYESANEPASHGWMVYRIKLKSTFEQGDSAASMSAIYFDYNSPIATNTVTTQLAALSTTSFDKDRFVLYPNPANKELFIKTSFTAEAKYSIMDSSGKLLQTDNVQNNMPIHISSLQTGLYFITITTNDGKATYKFLKN